ncbi:MAG: hypothetical protein PHF14_12530 [Verrucomicrobiota bacterium]|nr:hypothetical protein [Verrucomicrobiota bacterium]MDD8047283.1 hypothetical protein [Verrucomicrobiota bacterium]MDD8052276.1 hypothetical protein [Verrucomicrobiota bacterium]MDI9383342.1 hypothetical protein [Verrucomicrobiota bacterium]
MGKAANRERDRDDRNDAKDLVLRASSVSLLTIAQDNGEAADGQRLCCCEIAGW